MVKSKDASCDEDNGNDSKQYSNNGGHSLEISSSVTSSEAILLTLPKIAFSCPIKGSLCSIKRVFKVS